MDWGSGIWDTDWTIESTECSECFTEFDNVEVRLRAWQGEWLCPVCDTTNIFEREAENYVP